MAESSGVKEDRKGNFERSVSNPAGKGKLTVVYRKGDIVENLLGRFSGPNVIKNLLFGTPHAIIKRIPRESVNEILGKFTDVKWQGNVEVYLNHAPLFRQLKRLFSGERRPHLFFRVAAGIPVTAFGWAAAKLTREDFYNPFTEAVTTYWSHPKNPVQMHEIGHAINFDQGKRPSLRALIPAIFPPAALNLEWQASRNAMKHLEPGEERTTAKKLLEPAFGTYVGGILGEAAGGIRSLYGLRPDVLVGLAIGHIKGRLLPKNIFFNGEPVSKYQLGN